MCGIIAYLGERNAVPILLNGLHRLEYRGYDSAGITVRTKNGLRTIKAQGEIFELEKKLNKNMTSELGIAHTRWATHGEPNERNAHPHDNGRISIVHNGIIENFKYLKEALLSNVNFKSDTDSETIVHLIDKFYDGNLESAVEKALNHVEGTYGLAIISKDEEKIVAAKKGSPLVLGIGKGEYFVASDSAAVREYTDRMIRLEDGDILTVTKKGFNITNNREKKNRKIEIIPWKLEQLEKKGYDYFMLKEIFEQPDSLIDVMRGRMPGLKYAKLGGLDNLDDDYIKKIDRILLTACGTSWHAGLVAEYIMEKDLKIPVETEYASELRYKDPAIRKGDLIIAISQSGETADTLEALKEVKSRGAVILGVVNVVGSEIAQKTDTGVYLHAGPEIGVASTKAFTSQLVALNLINLYFAERKGTLSREEIQFKLSEMNKLPSKIETCLKLNDQIAQIAEEYKNATNFLYLGRGVNFPVALEGALKMKEISYIHAEGYPAAEMKHGPIALIDENMPVVFIANKINGTYEKILSNMQEVHTRKGRIIAIATEEDERIKELSEHVICVPDTPEFLTPIINAIPLQLLAYHVAVKKGLNVDKPRNLAKAVTVE